MDQFVAKGYGETKPIKPNTSAANRAMNRRVEFKILEIRDIAPVSAPIEEAPKAE
jgi:flagellar motor protein MotB